MKRILEFIKKVDIMLMIPFILYVLSVIFLIIFAGVGPSITSFLYQALFTFLIGILLSNKKYIINICGFVILVVFLVVNIITGYHEYIKHASGVIAIFVALYYILIYAIRLIFRILSKNKN